MSVQPVSESLESQVNRLADAILAMYPDEPGRGDPVHGEGAVDVAIRLLTRHKAEDDGLALCGICGDPIGEDEPMAHDVEVGATHRSHYGDELG